MKLPSDAAHIKLIACDFLNELGLQKFLTFLGGWGVGSWIPLGIWKLSFQKNT